MSLRHARAQLTGLAVLALAACAHDQDEGLPVQVDDRAVPTQADRHKIVVTSIGERVEIAAPADAAALAPEAIAEISAFAAAYRDGGHGPIVLSAPIGGLNDTAGGRIAEAARAALSAAGVSAALIARETYPAAADATPPVLLSFSRFTATPPDCRPLWEQNLAFAPSNRPWDSFGCAGQANLAALVADPRDLLGPRDETPADAHRRQTVLDSYRQGETTHATRSEDERIGISVAVQ